MTEPIHVTLDQANDPIDVSSCDIIELPNGQVFAAWNRGDASDRVLNRLRALPVLVVGKVTADRSGQTWPTGDPFNILTLASAQSTSDKASDDRTIAVQNPNLLRLQNGQVGLIYMARRLTADDPNAPQLNDLFFRTLNDPDSLPEALNWSGRRGIRTDSNPPIFDPGLFDLTHAAAVVLPTGTILATPGYQPFDSTPSQGIIGFASGDDGQTWVKTQGRVCFPDGTGPGETKVIHQSDGRVLMCIRPQYTTGSQHVVYLSDSLDGGNYFKVPVPMLRLPSPNTPCVVRQIPGSDDLVMIWNNCEGNIFSQSGALPRLPLCSAVLKGGWTTERGSVAPWENIKTIDSGSDLGDLGVCDYPACTFIGDRAFITYRRSVNQGTNFQVKLQLVTVDKSWFYEPETEALQS